MESFKLLDEYEAVCEFQSTRSGFRHVAVLLHNGSEVCRAKCCYLNRTWEAFEFESVLHTLIKKYFKGDNVVKQINAVKA